MNTLLFLTPIEGFFGILVLAIIILAFSWIANKVNRINQQSHEIDTEITEITPQQAIAEEAEDVYNRLSALRYRIECSTHPRKQIYMGELRQTMGYLYNLYQEFKEVPQEEPEPMEDDGTGNYHGLR